MSRGKPNPPPVVLRIEALSSGLPQATERMVSDFDGQPIEPKLPYGPTKPLASGLELTHRQHRERLENAKLLLEVLMPKHVQWTPLLPQARADSALQEPKPTHGPIITVDGIKHELVLPKVHKPFRRI